MKKTFVNRSELAERIAQAIPELSAREAQEALRILLALMRQTLARDERIEIRGFGSFAVHHYPPRASRNPSTGEPIRIGPRRHAHFRAGKAFRERVNP